MPIIKSAIKRAKQTIVRRERNVTTKRDIKDAMKAFTAKPSATTLSAVQSAIDTAVKKNVLNKRTAARRKANFSKTAKALGVKLGAAKATPVKKAVAPKAKAEVAKKPVAKKAVAAKTPVKKAAVKKPVAKKAPAKKPATK